MTQKSHAAGTACPPLAEGKLRLYSMRFCPYAERTRLVLAHFNVPHEVVNINLKSKPEWFVQKNPLGVVPVLEQGDKIVHESAICNEYLDDVHGHQALLTADPYKRARQKILMERFSKVTSAYYGLLMQTPEERRQTGELLQNGLDVFEKALAGKFFGGSAPDMVDFHIWPWFERFPMVQRLTGVDALTKDKFPKLNSWVASMLELPAVKTALVSTDLHAKFIDAVYLKGSSSPDYDMGLD